ncbi:MAG: quinone-dependent dihydroorotate dehydrogenase [Gammaproteobacteria bacterium]|nr:quinone-dependent dihydroorotate dehydrogenase [Gammaproteobacteria bacterium]
MYKLIRPLLFALDPELTHELSFGLLRGAYRVPGLAQLAHGCIAQPIPPLPVEVMGLRFPNPLGLAAGLDKNAEFIQPLADFGFGWLELGTVTPRPQPGNPKPRLFRLPEHKAIINRMGFNNVGAERFLANLRAQPRPCLLGINIGKNRDTPAERAIEDYRGALRAVYPHADYVTVNVSSPNTPGLRGLQEGEALEPLLAALKHEQAALTERHGRRVPLALKIAPDLDDAQIGVIAELVEQHRIEAVIATNTTLARPGLPAALATEDGGLSGRPLKELSTATIGKLYARLQGRVPIIGVGGVSSAADAWEKLTAGADLVQIYSALIFEGPGVVHDIVAGLAERVRAGGYPDLRAALANIRGK